MFNLSLKNIAGGILILTSIGDALKYTIQANKIKKVRTAKGMSRRFINLAILNDFIKLFYGIIIKDMFIINSSILALFCMCHLWGMIYWFYPYKCRGLIGFKKPSLWVYFVNSLISNKIRRRL